MFGELNYNRAEMKNSGELLKIEENFFSNLEKFAMKQPLLSNFEPFYLQQIYPLFSEMHFAQSKNISLLSYVDFFSQHLPLPLNLDLLTQAITLCVSYNNASLYLHRSIMYISPIKPHKYPTASIKINSDFIRVSDYLTKMLKRTDSDIRNEEKNVIHSGFVALNSAYNISRAYKAIIKAGSEGANITKETIKDFYGLTERDYIRVRDLVKLAARNEIYPGAKIQNIKKTTKGLERVITPSFTLSSQNQKRLEFYSLKMNKTLEQTLNRVVHDFFTLLDKQQRLDKFKR
ncbi:hypothetical protein [Citrobacter freundii]|uniref:hypothetical protein n=1 Tax=Citrobacter freundii TaxID=546 RepID=UPI001902CFEC|nr:hypothetical protein [Citrobacter freundii]MBJ8931584.1 hypothetical protein [Citrobacter freundii]